MAVAGLATFCTLLAACTSSATQGVDFKAPSDWKSFGIGPMQMWFPPGQTGSGKSGTVLMLMRLPLGSHPSPISASSFKDSKITENKTIEICGNHPAQYIAFTGERGNVSGLGQVVETNWDKNTYLALYVRDQNIPENADASAAIRNICPTSGSS